MDLGWKTTSGLSVGVFAGLSLEERKYCIRKGNLIEYAGLTRKEEGVNALSA